MASTLQGAAAPMDKNAQQVRAGGPTALAIAEHIRQKTKNSHVVRLCWLTIACHAGSHPLNFPPCAPLTKEKHPTTTASSRSLDTPVVLTPTSPFPTSLAPPCPTSPPRPAANAPSPPAPLSPPRAKKQTIHILSLLTTRRPSRAPVTAPGPPRLRRRRIRTVPTAAAAPTGVSP